MTKQTVSPDILVLCEKVTAKRPRTVIDHILKHGYITTDDLQGLYGYTHGPRAARDVRESGIPLETFNVVSESTGRTIAAYRFDDPAKIQHGRIGGRKAFSRAFRDQLVKLYDSRDAFTGEKLDARMLQIDHRVPYEIAGETVHHESNPEEYMLLDASSQRAKSWSCEQCVNWLENKDEKMCRSCFWAFPETYKHVAGEQVRRVDIEWRGTTEIAAFEKLRERAEREDMTVAAFIKKTIQNIVRPARRRDG